MQQLVQMGNCILGERGDTEDLVSLYFLHSSILYCFVFFVFFFSCEKRRYCQKTLFV